MRAEYLNFKEKFARDLYDESCFFDHNSKKPSLQTDRNNHFSIEI